VWWLVDWRFKWFVGGIEESFNNHISVMASGWWFRWFIGGIEEAFNNQLEIL